MNNIITPSKYRSRAFDGNVIAFSISYQRENLLARGMGYEHLRELLVRLARNILRHGASLAYGGNWEEKEGSFTYELLRLISAEQEDNSIGGPDSSKPIGKLYNHTSWPYYLKITPGIEARWIHCCRIIRVTQQDARLTDADIVADTDAENKQPRTLFNTAVTLSAMRRLSMEGISISIPDAPSEDIPPVVARIALGGKVNSYSGFMPGIFEEALLTLRHQRPLYILGGFGGAAELLARVLLDTGHDRPPELTLAWHEAKCAPLTQLLQSAAQFPIPPGCILTEQALDELFRFVCSARNNLSGTLNTGLTDSETRELLTTRNVPTAVRLIRLGLANQNKLPPLAA